FAFASPAPIAAASHRTPRANAIELSKATIATSRNVVSRAPMRSGAGPSGIMPARRFDALARLAGARKPSHARMAQAAPMAQRETTLAPQAPAAAHPRMRAARQKPHPAAFSAAEHPF